MTIPLLFYIVLLVIQLLSLYSLENIVTVGRNISHLRPKAAKSSRYVLCATRSDAG